MLSSKDKSKTLPSLTPRPSHLLFTPATATAKHLDSLDLPAFWLWMILCQICCFSVSLQKSPLKNRILT